MSYNSSDKSYVRPFTEVYNLYDVSNARRIGAGGFGKVYLIRDKVSHKKHAAKYQKLSSRKLKELVRNEASYLRELSGSSRIVKITGYFEKNEHSLMVLEYLEAGDLFSKISSINYQLTEEKCKRFVKEIVKGLNFIHERQIVHLDLKPANIMLRTKEDEFKLKLIDFGLARRLTNGHVKVGFCGTVGFMAPEIARCQYKADPMDMACPATDMFSLGVITYMLVSGGKEPFWEGGDVRAIKNTLKKPVDFPDVFFKNVSHAAQNFITALLEKKSSDRMSGPDCLIHDWLRKDEVDGRKSFYAENFTFNTKKMRRFQARRRWKKLRMYIMTAYQFNMKFPNSDD